MSRESDVHLLQHDLNTPVAYPDDGTSQKNSEKFWKFGKSNYLCCVKESNKADAKDSTIHNG